ncbi:hypothetical protein [uncultured Microscilla sp.]|uniref:hypothetical protein n=1 Tax=uncultured Microscilla sp. TaxID=432653 RepID=UPI0026339B1D|nr:hypothetical protein [uncultured Microscilla sp.]
MNYIPIARTADTIQQASRLWEAYPTNEGNKGRELFWAAYYKAIDESKKTQKQHMNVWANEAPVQMTSNQAMAAPQLFTINPNQRQVFLKKLWAYQVLPVAKAFTVAWFAMSVFFGAVNQDGGSYQLITISAILLVLFITGIAYHYWVICRPLADMQLMIDRLGIIREGAGLDHLSISYSEILDIKRNPLGMQVFIQPKGRIQEEHESVLLPEALLNYPLACELLQRHLATHHQYYDLTSY